MSQKVTEAAQTTAAGAAQTPEGTQRPEAAGTQEVSRKVSLEVQTPEERS